MSFAKYITEVAPIKQTVEEALFYRLEHQRYDAYCTSKHPIINSFADSLMSVAATVMMPTNLQYNPIMDPFVDNFIAGETIIS